MTASRDESSHGDAGNGKRATRKTAGTYENSVLSGFRKQPRLAPKEEIFHCRKFFETRGRLGLQLSHFPRIIAEQLGQCKTTEIQRLDKDGEVEHKKIDRKRDDLQDLLNALSAVATTLERIAGDDSDDANASRQLLVGSLERLLQPYIFHSRFYDKCLLVLNQLSSRLQDDEDPALLIRSRILMPAEFFHKTLCDVRELHRHMHDERKILLEANLGLVVSVVKRYNNCGLSFEDLFQEGYVGLALAVDKFQPMRGHRFSTYAVWWIRQGITQALSSHSRTIRIPANMARALARIRRAEQTLLQTFGREPTADEIADEVELDVERVRAWRKMEQQPISLESPISENGGQVSDLIEDGKITRPDEAVSNKLLIETITEVLGTLKDREREIIIHRFGLHEQSTMTLEELSKRFNVTHERIRQIEAAALKKLRDPSRRKYFDGYY